MYQYKYFTVTGEGVVTTKYQEHREVIHRLAVRGLGAHLHPEQWRSIPNGFNF